jgi:hypothetical protein
MVSSISSSKRSGKIKHQRQEIHRNNKSENPKTFSELVATVARWDGISLDDFYFADENTSAGSECSQSPSSIRSPTTQNGGLEEVTINFNNENRNWSPAINNDYFIPQSAHESNQSLLIISSVTTAFNNLFLTSTEVHDNNDAQYNDLPKAPHFIAKNNNPKKEYNDSNSENESPIMEVQERRNSFSSIGEKRSFLSVNFLK